MMMQTTNMHVKQSARLMSLIDASLFSDKMCYLEARF